MKELVAGLIAVTAAGRAILAAQAREGWGAEVIDRFAADLRREFPEMKGFSPRNLKYMRRFAEVFPDATIVPQPVAQIPWGHIRAILDKVPELSAREYYIRKTIEHGWSRNILALQIDGRLYECEGQAITNFPATLPPPQSDLARVRDFFRKKPDAVKPAQRRIDSLEHDGREERDRVPIDVSANLDRLGLFDARHIITQFDSKRVRIT